MFWQLLFQPEDDSYGLYLKPVASPDEVTWKGRLKLSYKIFIKEIKNNHITELCNSNLVIPPDTKIGFGFGCSKIFKKSALQNGELIIGVTIKNLEYKENKPYSPKCIPKNLIDAWKDQLFDYQPADVEFNVQDEKFYACSSILSKRSEYFARILSGQWSESTIIQGDNDDNVDNITNDSNNKIKISKTLSLRNCIPKNNEKSSYQIKHRIEISEYDPMTFSSMLEYLYTNQVKWTNKDNESIAIGLFRLADQYLLSDLRERARFRILNELNLFNVSEIMFNLASRYEDLKEPVLKFMAKNFEEINNSQEFKNVLANLVNYPNYNVVLSEIWAEFFKIQKVKD
ncbi:BTB/POZ protein [Rhizophagus clarus]|nr:BTB/POZ protein [Rhizophagus clarus]